MPARVAIYSLPDKSEIRAKSLFMVHEVHMYWHEQSKYLAVHVRLFPASHSLVSAAAAGRPVRLRMKRHAPIQTLFGPTSAVVPITCYQLLSHKRLGGCIAREIAGLNEVPLLIPRVHMHWFHRIHRACSCPQRTSSTFLSMEETGPLVMQVAKHTKSKKTTFATIELFTIKSKTDVINDVLELPSKGDKVLQIAWEPKGDRFAVVHGDMGPGSKFNVSFFTMLDKTMKQGAKLLGTITNRCATSCYLPWYIGAPLGGLLVACWTVLTSAR